MIMLVDQNPDLIEAWKRVFPHNVPIIWGDILNVRATALIAPGNSSGSMTGGLDLAIAQKWPFLESKVQDQAIMEVGTTIFVPFLLGSATFEYLVYAPTMRGAMDVSHTENAYVVMKTILAHELGTMAIPGLCAGVGKMPVDKVAEQMARAYNEAV